MPPVPVAAPSDAKPAPRHPTPARAVAEAPPVALALPPESGLELVETKFHAAPPPEAEAPAGPRRVRPPKAVVADEPLQMIETTHKDASPPAA